ncbi:hypothetical protein ACGFYY_41130 [Streptomyces sp. NPDC048331]|uniref:hypothetical protein n=1 Tax=Streptomyces sp. NPDC048331 TaxID=3365534 RepID=UPI00371CF5A6
MPASSALPRPGVPYAPADLEYLTNAYPTANRAQCRGAAGTIMASRIPAAVYLTPPARTRR